MAYVISDSCISCGACAAGCPCDAISEGAEHYEIDADKQSLSADVRFFRQYSLETRLRLCYTEFHGRCADGKHKNNNHQQKSFS